MEESPKNKSLFKKFISILSGKPTEKGADSLSSGKFAPSSREPVDLVFVKNFTNSGGKFLYCEEESEAYDFLNNIIQETSVESIVCHNSNIQSILKNAGVSYKSEGSDISEKAFCCDCEFLISFNGGIMICDNQTKGKKLEVLPEVFVVIARTSQIVENLRSGLTGIRAKYKGNIPSNITTIHGLLKDSDIEEKSSCKKDIYLLLLEDQL